MLNVKFICVGKMRERFYLDAFEEYRKRLGAYCRLELLEPQEQRLPERPSQAEIDAAVKAALEAAGVSEKQEEPAADPVEEPEAEE